MRDEIENAVILDQVMINLMEIETMHNQFIILADGCGKTDSFRCY